MSNILFFLFAISFSILFSQNQMIEVEYKKIRHVELKDGDVQVEGANFKGKDLAKQLQDAINKPTYYKLTTNGVESIWEYLPRIDNSQREGEGGNFFISFSGTGGNGLLYKNIPEKRTTQSIDDSFTKGLLKDSLKQYHWKITRMKKEIMGYEVRKAIAKIIEDSTEIEVWYAPKLNYKDGPEKFWGLPGLILELEETSNRKRRSKFIYKAIALTPIAKDERKTKIKEPNKGKVFTKESLEQERKKQMEKLREMYGGGVDTSE